MSYQTNSNYTVSDLFVWRTATVVSFVFVFCSWSVFAFFFHITRQGSLVQSVNPRAQHLTALVYTFLLVRLLCTRPRAATSVLKWTFALFQLHWRLLSDPVQQAVRHPQQWHRTGHTLHWTWTSLSAVWNVCIVLHGLQSVHLKCKLTIVSTGSTRVTRMSSSVRSHSAKAVLIWKAGSLTHKLPKPPTSDASAPPMMEMRSLSLSLHVFRSLWMQGCMLQDNYKRSIIVLQNHITKKTNFCCVFNMTKTCKNKCESNTCVKVKDKFEHPY